MMTTLEIAGCCYVVGAAGMALGYLGFFRGYNETPLVTLARVAFVSLLWPLWAVMLLGMVLGL